MPSPWSDFPATYRSKEIQFINEAIRAGECVSIIGLSGSGKSNLLGFLANRVSGQPSLPRMILVDCNRLSGPSIEALFRLIRSSLGDHQPVPDEFNALFELVDKEIGQNSGICFLLDRFELLSRAHNGSSEALAGTASFGNLRALRDAHKYNLTYVIASRRPLEPDNELPRGSLRCPDATPRFCERSVKQSPAERSPTQKASPLIQPSAAGLKNSGLTNQVQKIYARRV